MFFIKRPLITEKTNTLSEKSTYVFKVDRRSRKDQIKKEVEERFDVKVRNVRTLTYHKKGKRTRFGVGKQKVWKKAIVRLQKGEKIKIFEGGLG